MPVRLFRIDDRLIHGQVVLGWARPLGIAEIALVDDAVAASPWEQELYRMAVPPELRVQFVSVEQGRRRLADWEAGSAPVLVLTGDVATMARLLDGAVAPHDVNLGGIHHRPGRTERLPYVFLTEDEWQALHAMEAAGAHVTARDVPTASAVALEALA